MYTLGTPHRRRVTINTGSFTYTKQSCKNECDINQILKQYQKTGIISHINNSSAAYIDLPDDIDYQTSLSIISQASNAFAGLPAKIRERFANDPGQFLAAIQNPAMRQELIDLGVINKPPVAPLPPEPAAPASAPPPAPPAAPVR